MYSGMSGSWVAEVSNAWQHDSLWVLQAENLNTAFELYKEMEGIQLEADCVTYATLMDLCAEARQGQRAITLMQVCCFARNTRCVSPVESQSKDRVEA